jgi:phenylacetate-CoA ligase
LKKNGFFLKCFRTAYQNILAYKDYIDTHTDNTLGINGLEKFEDIPIKDKKSYILKYPLKKLFPNGRIPSMGHASSGSSGKPTLWFRGEKQNKIGAEIYKKIFAEIFEIKKDEPTLVLICFAMGMWVAGTHTLMACQEISRSGYKVTTFPTGMDTQAICDILKATESSFKNIVLIGYPFFLDVVFNEILKASIPIRENFFIITAGDKFSEEWRMNTLEKISQPIEQSKRIVSVYGSSDAGILGYETPLSISIRQEALQNSLLYKKLFGDSDPSVIPTLVQYEPKKIFFEEKNGELILTADLDCPLIRYNIHDRGKVINFNEMKKMLMLSGSKALVEKTVSHSWRKPFLVVDTRTDVAVTFNAIKIYPEQIKAGLHDPRIAEIVSGSFIAYAKKDVQNKNRIHLELELTPGLTDITGELKKEISDCIVNHLKASNSEYRAVDACLSNDTMPIFLFHPYGASQFKTAEQEGHEQTKLVSLKGKKSRMLFI